MTEITNEIRREVMQYLETDYTENELNMLPNEFYSFYYRCMQSDMNFADADRYAILNTLFNYDIGMENARAIDNWMYEHDYDIYDLSTKDKSRVALAVAELGLTIDFGGWIKEDYTEYKFFEK